MKIRDLKLTYIVICKQDTGVKLYEGPFTNVPKIFKDREVLYIHNNYCEIK